MRQVHKGNYPTTCFRRKHSLNAVIAYDHRLNETAP